jgi:hypothetical protein
MMISASLINRFTIYTPKGVRRSAVTERLLRLMSFYIKPTPFLLLPQYRALSQVPGRSIPMMSASKSLRNINDIGSAKKSRYQPL